MSGGRAVAFVARRGGPPPEEDPGSALVCAALAAGYRWSCDHPFLHYLERVASGAVERTVTWTLDGGQSVVLDGERLDFTDFRKRATDDRWREAHPTSIITRLMIAAEGMQHLQVGLFRRPPHVMVRRGKAHVLIPGDASPERRAELLGMLEGR
jgi:hypothetical protein